MRTVLVLDVNETLVDLAPLREAIVARLGDPGAPGEWFLRLLHASTVATLTANYEDFDSLGRSTLQAVAGRRGIELMTDEAADLVSVIRRLPAHPEVAEALAGLRQAGFTTAALTNSTLEAAQEQLAFAGLLDRFDEVLSVDEVRRYKPAPQPYLLAADRLGVPIGQVRMVAAHDWDVAGAIASGAGGAFVARPGQVYRDGLPRPDIEGSDLASVAEAILDRDDPSD